ncbi:protein mono-ADP-ribosyltransferase PARP12-like [Frankliniella occidentalis]|uniref:Poly [ADP-ribose] polymerase n=1 Tax=Frankliniella occidentalis TaxID=133901 RepID=A0A6J1RXH6_FRAOC|nr:protein mono-ADP-ribosyltransferase PARP12-like [Frankliniella occidentalis]XP_052128572.1 protein mono-ADP-ribosyltransferase PARP12-like [Frankliniella occidentalis]
MEFDVQRSVLTPGDADYQTVSNLFLRKEKGHFPPLEIQSIEAVQNYSLQQRFKEKKDEYERAYGRVDVIKLWHGTKSSRVSSILQNNFDVSRYCGHRYGAGVSFTASPKYASHYCDKGTIGCILLCDVLVSNIVEVPENIGKDYVLEKPPFIPGVYPPLRYDTTAKNKKTMNVIVKFESNSYCPTHVVNFKRTRHARCNVGGSRKNTVKPKVRYPTYPYPVELNNPFLDN